jgi:TPP-dependent pyruvate/acetoin dehydrogenase alpha subunit
VPIASQLPHAAGLGLAIKIKNEKKVVLAFFGDGASSEGDCHEAMNFATALNTPVVFICLNNQYAISVPISHQMKSETIAQRAIAYGINGIRVDGNDILAVYTATKEAVEKAREGGGPTLIEALTYRLAPHTTADDPKRYRSEEEVSLWQKREPLLRFKKYLYDKQILSQTEEEKLEAEINQEIKRAVEKEESIIKGKELTDPLRIFDYLYAEQIPSVQKQKEELSEYLKQKRGISHA